MFASVLFALRHMSLVLTLQSLPFAIYAILSSELRAARKLLVGSAYAVAPTIALFMGAGRSVFVIACGALYYAILGLGVNRLGAALRSRVITRGGVFVLAGLLFLVLPGALVPGLAQTTFLVVGWDAMLSVYSYCVETSRPRAACAPLSQAVFFVFVDPTLLYASRGTRAATPLSIRGIQLRAAAGVGVMFANNALLRPVASRVREMAQLGRMPVSAAMAIFIGYYAMRVLTEYAAHSGLASIRIGLMRGLGWSVPERYLYPLAARSPMDFWRRWNTYVRVWLEAYCYLPLARRLSRKRRGVAAAIVAALATLVASGLLHDGYALAAQQRLAFGYTKLFVAAGLLYALWSVASSWNCALRARVADSLRPSFDVLSRVSGHLALCAALLAAAAGGWGNL